jgi:hypothetical protein
MSDSAKRMAMIDPGRKIEIVRGLSTVWSGYLAEPTPTTDGWQLTGVGLGVQGANFRALLSGSDLNFPVNSAITRGLPWKNPGITTGWSVLPQDNGSFTVTDHLTNVTSKQGLTWSVSRNGTLSVYELPDATLSTTVPTRIIVTDQPVTRTLFADITTIYVRYMTSDDSQGNQTFATTSVKNAAAAAKHGVFEEYIDITSAGVTTETIAQAVVNELFKKYSRAAWNSAFTVSPGQVLNRGGTPIDLACERSGEIYRVLMMDAPYGGEVNAGQVMFVGGQYQYDDDAQLAVITPYQSYKSDLATLLSNFERWLGMDAASISYLIVAIIAVVSGLSVYFVSRRTNSGTTRTSEAATLWQQSQSMFIQITAERDKAIEQRDRLMSAQSEQVIPVLSSILSAVNQLRDILDDSNRRISDMASQVDTITNKSGATRLPGDTGCGSCGRQYLC